MKIHFVPQGHSVLPLTVRRGKCSVGEKIFGYSKIETRDTATLVGQNARDFKLRHLVVLSLNYGYVNKHSTHRRIYHFM
jgi:hypothetical protein